VVGVVGKDANGSILLSRLRKKGIRTNGVAVDPSRSTFTYTKVRARVENTPSRELFRMDILPGGPPDARTEATIVSALRRESRGADAVIVLDQIHHLVTPRLLDEVPRIAREARALLHGSSRDHIALFHDFDLITPNDREASGAVGGRARGVEAMGRLLQRRGRHRKILLTLGAEGMVAFPEAGAPGRLPTLAQEVVDVTGAGDALSSVAVLGNVLGWDLGTLAWTASHAAAIAIAHVGTHHVSREELEARVQMPS
jgi:rfaE bifunctional protein kinase chain/domain